MLERSVLSYKNLSERFKNQNSDYSKQYCGIYNVRISKMRKILHERITEKWGDEYPVCKLHEVSVDNYPKCIVVGTLFKDQKLKPSVLKQLAEGNQLVPQPVHKHFTDSSDVLYIEDELQRFQLMGELDSKCLVTGISCALLGYDLGKGKFMVEDYIFPGYRDQVERPLEQESHYLVFISGLDLMNIERSLLPLQLFCNWIAGTLGDSHGVEPSKVVRLIIAGNSIKTGNLKSKASVSMTSRITESVETIDSIKTLDVLLVQLCQLLDVDLMPGENDPSNHVLPQQNMHHCMFPESAIYKTMNSVSNPYECEVGTCRILGSSGQPVTDAMRFSDIETPIQVLEECLKWNHIAPTAPDTLGCFPYYDNDPFILENCPHVFFAGNQEKFDTKLVKGESGQSVRLICIPEFASSSTIGVLNLKNLDCFPVNFMIL